MWALVPADYIEVYVDETGDRGFGPKSSPYFCFAACAFKHSNADHVVEAMKRLNGALGRNPGQPIHAVQHLKKHDQLMEAVERLAGLRGLLKVFHGGRPEGQHTTYCVLEKQP